MLSSAQFFPYPQFLISIPPGKIFPSQIIWAKGLKDW
jgi:hypothetical protein